MPDLKDMKDEGVVTATIEAVDYDSSGQEKHRVKWNDYADPWRGWKKNNRLESLWKEMPTGKKGIQAFEVEKAKVPKGTNNIQVKWKVWDKSKNLRNCEVELYSVMRAEYHYIKEKKCKKLASKYPFWLWGKIPIENCGIDSFFSGKDSFVVCESKFTRNESLFADWKKNEKKVWSLLGTYKIGKKRYRQMSWKWIKDRAKRAVSNAELGTKVFQETKTMEKAIRKQMQNVERVMNIYGAAQVPVYPGKYTFISEEASKITQSPLHLQWTMDIDEKEEFIILGKDFDKWEKERRQPVIKRKKK